MTEPSEMHEAMCPALTGGRCTCERNDPAVDKAWARFCGVIGDGPDAPYPGMISAFERYYSQSFADKDWRNEASVWAAAWKQALLTAAAPTTTQPAPAHADASYESMNLAVMVLSDCGHSSNYKPLLERVAGRIDRHVERLLTAQQADIAMRAQAAPQPLPTSPTQPQAGVVPLTDGQIAEMMRETWGCASIAPRHAMGFARAVERHHGIKGGQHGTDT